jgi:ABC-2 type transport system permease protein
VPKLFALFGFITVELFLWGFITFWVQTIGPVDAGLDFLLLILSAFIFWSVFELSQRSFSVSFLEEVWSRNVINIFAAPIKLSELVMGFALVGVVQTLLAFFYITPIAFLLFALNIWDMGLYIIPFFMNVLIAGWGIGVVAIGGGLAWWLLDWWFGSDRRLTLWHSSFLFCSCHSPQSTIRYQYSLPCCRG